ncbi:MAG TPA: V-type ATP synthase subunit I [Clostridia bacterium]
MAKVRMKRIEIIALQEDRKNIVERLQRREILEFEEVGGNELAKMSTSSNIAQFDKYIETVNQAIEILSPHSQRKKSLLSLFDGRREIEKQDFIKFLDQSNSYIKLCYDIIDARRVITENKAQIAKLEASIENLSKWQNLDIPLGYKGTKETRCFVGVFPTQLSEEDLSKRMEEAGVECAFAHILEASKYFTSAVVFAHKETADKTKEILRAMSFAPVSDEFLGVPSDIRSKLEGEITALQNVIFEKESFIKDAAAKLDQIEILADYLIMRKEKYLALSKIGQTKNSFVISGYIPEIYAQKIIKELEEHYTVAITLQDADEEENVPVALKNKSVVSAVEPIVEMYSLPSKSDPDPSPVVAFFYYLFFGMMLSDAGYGLVMSIISAIILRRKNIEQPIRKTFTMFFYCGLSTLFWGALFGSWFGDIIPIIYKEIMGKPAPSIALWYEPMSDPMRLLTLSFALGIAHLFAGVALKIKVTWESGDKLGAILDNVPTYFLVTGAAILGGQILTPIPPILIKIASYLAIIGLILVILTAGRNKKGIFGKIGGGLYGVYGIASGYLSDILSYSRLLALGLATGSIASVINLMGSMIGTGALKIIFLVPIFILGHTLNMAINILGAYVHTNRLQFVEFFSKFYEGGGRPFRPLKLNTKYIKFKDNF